MLKNGKYIKEPPIIIGSQYIPDPKDKPITDEELIFQDALLHKQTSPTLLHQINSLIFSTFFLKRKRNYEDNYPR